jgi:TonB-linked SusC/RagA family outer membrane protein
MRKQFLLSLACLLSIYSALAQNQVISGRVTDRNNTPLPGVSVQVQGTNIGTTTNESGNYTLTAPANARVLVFSFVGFGEMRADINNRNTVNVTLSPENAGMQEVVVTGYTTRRRTEFTGATSKVTARQIEQIPMASFEHILQGRAPGLYIASGSGQPGAAARVNIRGVGTISGSFDPLYVVDGIPVEPGVFRTMNPNDFESVDVLKDAAGASLYGSRGANGVIVITTKRGRSGQTNVQYRTQVGFNTKPVGKFEMMNTAERLRFEAELLGPSGILATNAQGLTGYPGWDLSPTNPRWSSLTPAQQQAATARLDSIRNIDVDWADIFFRTGRFQSHEVNASGGAQGMNFYTSLSYFRQEGVVIRSDLERYTFRGNIDFRADRLNVQLRSAAGWSTQSGIESEAGIALANPIAAAYLTLPYERAFNDSGRVLVGAGKIGPNALDRLNTTTSVTNQFKGTLGLTATFNLFGGLALKTISGLDYRNNLTSRFIDPTSFAGRQVSQGQQGSLNEGNAENLQLVTTSGLTFSRTFADMHVVNAQAMFEFISNRFRSFNATGFGLNAKLPNTPAAITPGSATNNFIPLIGGSRTRNAIYSLFALADYTYNRKYTVSASIRRDAPSQVPEANRDNIFWSVGASWNAISESFLQSQNIFQDLRLRASHGSTANAAGFTSDFGYLSTYGAGSYAGIPGIIPASPGNEGYQLESQVITNVGLDLGMWNRRVRATFEWYRKESRNLFVNQQLSRTTGFLTLSTNAAKVRNTGIEAQVSVDVLSNEDWLVTLGVNAAYLKNRIVSLGQLNEFTSGTGIFRVGLPIGTHYVVGFIGVDPATGNPIYTDVNGNPTNTYSASNNRADFGTYLPKYTGGASVDARWKGIDFSILFAFAEDVWRFNNERFFYEGGNNLFQYNQSVRMLNAWRKPGDVTDIQRIGAGSTRQFTSRDINDASFVRLRNVQLGYTFNFPNERPIRGIRLYLQGQNVYTWTKWQGFDPEESNNIATYEFPNPRTFSIGLDVNF